MVMVLLMLAGRAQAEQDLPVFHRLAVVDQNLHDLAVDLGFGFRGLQSATIENRKMRIELETLLSDGLRGELERRGVRLISYHDVAKATS